MAQNRNMFDSVQDGLYQNVEMKATVNVLEPYFYMHSIFAPLFCTVLAVIQ
jgi:hypothetical protein